MTRRALAACFLTLVGAVLALQVLVFHAVRLDDAYITFRYGQNLARGAGLVFNPGERLMGSTSPGESLLSAAAYFAVGHEALPGVMAAVGCVGWTAQAIAFFSLLKPSAGPFRAGLVALGIAVGAAGSAQWLPLETNLACAGTFAAIALAMESRWVAASAACAFAGLMRPDAYLAALLLAPMCVAELAWCGPSRASRASRGLGFWCGPSRAARGLGFWCGPSRAARGLAVARAWKPAVTLIGLAAPWPLFATLYFGSPVPQSALVKYNRADHLAYARHIFDSVPGEVAIAPVASVALAAKLAFWALAIAGSVILVRAARRLWVLPAYAVLHAVAYVALAPAAEFQWHLYPLTAVTVSLGLLAVATLLEKIPRPPGYALAAAVVLLCGAGTARFAARYPGEPWFGARDEIYREVSAYLVAHAAPTDIVDAEEVGTLAYYTNLRMNDHAMLVTRYPGDVFWRLSHGRRTKLRWMVLNGTQLLHGREIEPFFVPFYEHRPKRFFDHGGWRLAVVDLGGAEAPPVPAPP